MSEQSFREAFVEVTWRVQEVSVGQNYENYAEVEERITRTLKLKLEGLGHVPSGTAIEIVSFKVEDRRYGNTLPWQSPRLIHVTYSVQYKFRGE